jgi:hypothetical protein
VEDGEIVSCGDPVCAEPAWLLPLQPMAASKVP